MCHRKIVMMTLLTATTGAQTERRRSHRDTGSRSSIATAN